MPSGGPLSTFPVLHLHACFKPWVRLPAGGYGPNPEFLRLQPDMPMPYLRLAHSCCAAEPKGRPPFDDVTAQLQVMLASARQGLPALEPPPT